MTCQNFKSLYLKLWILILITMSVKCDKRRQTECNKIPFYHITCKETVARSNTQIMNEWMNLLYINGPWPMSTYEKWMQIIFLQVLPGYTCSWHNTYVHVQIYIITYPSNMCFVVRVQWTIHNKVKLILTWLLFSCIQYLDNLSCLYCFAWKRWIELFPDHPIQCKC